MKTVTIRITKEKNVITLNEVIPKQIPNPEYSPLVFYGVALIMLFLHTNQRVFQCFSAKQIIVRESKEELQVTVWHPQGMKELEKETIQLYPEYYQTQFIFKQDVWAFGVFLLKVFVPELSQESFQNINSFVKSKSLDSKLKELILNAL